MQCLSVVTEENGASIRDFVESKICHERLDSSRIPLTCINMSCPSMNQVGQCEVTNSCNTATHMHKHELPQHEPGRAM